MRGNAAPPPAETVLTVTGLEEMAVQDETAVEAARRWQARQRWLNSTLDVLSGFVGAASADGQVSYVISAYDVPGESGVETTGIALVDVKDSWGRGVEARERAVRGEADSDMDREIRRAFELSEALGRNGGVSLVTDRTDSDGGFGPEDDDWVDPNDPGLHTHPPDDAGRAKLASVAELLARPWSPVVDSAWRVTDRERNLGTLSVLNRAGKTLSWGDVPYACYRVLKTCDARDLFVRLEVIPRYRAASLMVDWPHEKRLLTDAATLEDEERRITSEAAARAAASVREISAALDERERVLAGASLARVLPEDAAPLGSLPEPEVLTQANRADESESNVSGPQITPEPWARWPARNAEIDIANYVNLLWRSKQPKPTAYPKTGLPDSLVTLLCRVRRVGGDTEYPVGIETYEGRRGGGWRDWVAATREYVDERGSPPLWVERLYVNGEPCVWRTVARDAPYRPGERFPAWEARLERKRRQSS